MGGWITLGILLCLLLPLGVSIRYDAGGALIKLTVGPVKITVFPMPKKEPKRKSQEKTDGKKKEVSPLPQNPEPPKTEKKVQQSHKNGGSWTDFLSLVKEVFRFLGDFRRKLRLDRLELKLIMAAEDPCDLAVNYGRAWAAVGNLVPQLERFFVIKKRNVEVECDFAASETLVIARLDITITLGRLLAAVIVFGVRALIKFLKIQKMRKGGANQ